MTLLEDFLHNNNLQDPEDIEALLDCASLMRQLVDKEEYSAINRVINYLIRNCYYEAFLWTIGILQEEFEKEDCTLEDFYCDIGRRITNYDEFVDRLNVDFNVLKNYIEKVFDNNGEVESFFNVSVYKTDFKNVYLVSSENFDTKDNDYIQYRLLFVKNII